MEGLVIAEVSDFCRSFVSLWEGIGMLAWVSRQLSATTMKASRNDLPNANATSRQNELTLRHPWQ